jgi:hypothetical protein
MDTNAQSSRVTATKARCFLPVKGSSSWSAVAKRNRNVVGGRSASHLKVASHSVSRRAPKQPARIACWSFCCAALLLAGGELSAAEQAGEIRGIVKDEQGSPLADVKVQMCGFEPLQSGTGPRALRTGIMPSYSTDKEGRFVVPVKQADMRYDFYCDKPGYAPTFLDGLTNQSMLNVVLKRGLTVTGTVNRLTNGKVEPVMGGPVELRLPNADLWYQQRTMTDHNGRYTFHVTPPPAGKKWQVVFVGEVVQLDVKVDQPVEGPDFEVAVAVHGISRGDH